MGKGDRRSKRGKIFRGTFGKRRPKPEKERKKAVAIAAAAAADSDFVMSARGAGGPALRLIPVAMTRSFE